MIKWLIILCLLMSTWAGAGTLVTRTYAPGTDAAIIFAISEAYHGLSDTLIAGKNATAASRSIVWFDTTSGEYGRGINDSLDLCDSVVNCSLYLSTKAVRGTPDTMLISLLLRIPKKTSADVGGDDSVGYTRYKPGSNWSTSGAGSYGNDYNDTIKILAPTSGWTAVDVTSLLTKCIRGAGVYAKFYGFRIKCKTEATDVRHVWYANEATGTTNDPYLKINYYIPKWKNSIHKWGSTRNGKHTRHGK
jgi:hypothetical protein